MACASYPSAPSARTTSDPERIEISRSALSPPMTTAMRSLPAALRCIDKDSDQMHFELQCDVPAIQHGAPHARQQRCDVFRRRAAEIVDEVCVQRRHLSLAFAPSLRARSLDQARRFVVGWIAKARTRVRQRNRLGL